MVKYSRPEDVSFKCKAIFFSVTSVSSVAIISLPPCPERLVFLNACNILLQLVTLHPYHTPVRDVPFQIAVFDCSLKPLVILSQEYLSPFFREVTEVDVLLKICFAQHLCVDELKDDMVNNNGLKYL